MKPETHRTVLLFLLLLMGQPLMAQTDSLRALLPVWRAAADRFFSSPRDTVANYVIDITFNTLFPDVRQ